MEDILDSAPVVLLVTGLQRDGISAVLKATLPSDINILPVSIEEVRKSSLNNNEDNSVMIFVDNDHIENISVATPGLVSCVLKSINSCLVNQVEDAFTLGTEIEWKRPVAAPGANTVSSSIPPVPQPLPTLSPSIDPLQHMKQSIGILKSKLTNKEMEDVLKLLGLYVGNILDDLSNPAKRKIRVGNAGFQNKLIIPAGREIGIGMMKAIGFDIVNDNSVEFLVMPIKYDDRARLERISVCLSNGGDEPAAPSLFNNTVASSQDPLAQLASMPGGLGGLPGGLGNLLQNPAIANMARNMMRDPAAMNNLMRQAGMAPSPNPTMPSSFGTSAGSSTSQNEEEDIQEAIRRSLNM
jgi:hypothetical protein